MHYFVYAGAVGLAMMVSSISLAQNDVLVASNGVALPVPPIENLSCSSKLQLMHRFSASEYRRPGQVPATAPDKQLFAYENALARSHYESCQEDQGAFGNPSKAFGKSFN